MKITAEEICSIIERVEDVKDYNERMRIITQILTQFYNSKYQPEEQIYTVENKDKFCY